MCEIAVVEHTRGFLATHGSPWLPGMCVQIEEDGFGETHGWGDDLGGKIKIIYMKGVSKNDARLSPYFETETNVDGSIARIRKTRIDLDKLSSEKEAELNDHKTSEAARIAELDKMKKAVAAVPLG
jgi:hypothetical protein